MSYAHNFLQENIKQNICDHFIHIDSHKRFQGYYLFSDWIGLGELSCIHPFTGCVLQKYLPPAVSQQ